MTRLQLLEVFMPLFELMDLICTIQDFFLPFTFSPLIPFPHASFFLKSGPSSIKYTAPTQVTRQVRTLSTNKSTRSSLDKTHIY
jgi:hypothetical protein